MRAQYRRLLRFYGTSGALRTGTLARHSHPDVLAFSRRLGAEEVFVLVNVRNRSVTYPLPTGFAGTTWTEALPGAGAITLPGSLKLAPYGFSVLRR